jgi:peroxiredoxin
MLVLALTFLVPTGARPSEPGKPVPDVKLLGTDGKPVMLHSLKDKSAVVAVFLSFECPVSNSYVPVLNELAARFKDKKVRFLVIVPTRDGAAELARQAKEYHLACPVYTDAGLTAARAFGAKTVPEAFVLDGKFTPRYRGRIDDSYLRRLQKKPSTEHHDLRDAIEAVLAGKPVREAVTTPVGCPIYFPRARAATTKVTYHRDVLPILQNRCQQCHRPGEVGPFSLMTYRQAVTWADDIKSFTRSKKMPPWKPTAGLPMKGARLMTDAEIATVAEWVDGGTPEGDPKDAPAPKQFTKGWTLGPPDLILGPKDVMTIGATGPDIFRCFVLPTGLKEDKFVVAYEVRPGNPRVVHHTLHFLDTKGRARKLDERFRKREKKPNEADIGPGYNSRMGPGFFPPSGDVGGWAPGLRPHYLPEGVGYYLPKEADVVLQMHYHRTGRVEKDKTRLGLYFARKPADRPLQGIVIPGRMLYIPANADNYAVRGDAWLAQDSVFHVVTPHMHLLGRTIKVSMTPPGGKKTTLVEIKDWDYNWQETYYFKEPVKAPAGTKLTVEATYDNSARNPLNPNSPPKAVFVGEQTTNEMCFGFIGATTNDGSSAGFRLTPNGPVIRRPGPLPKRATSMR